jgi:ubiquitin carboxyl-terminal hydrolase 9/13
MIHSIHSYANSVLQALYFCTPFRELLLQVSDHSVSQTPSLPPPTTPILPPSQPRPKPQRKQSVGGITDPPIPNGTPHIFHPPIPASPPTLFSALRSLFYYISKHPDDKGVVPPRAFIDKLKEVNELFRSTMHQDAHEFLNYLLNKIMEEIEDEKRLGEDRKCYFKHHVCRVS